MLAVAFLLAITSDEPAPTYLLGSPQVRRELGLSAETSRKVVELLNRGNEFGRGGLMTHEEARAQEEARKLNPPEAFYRQAQALLSPTQTRRVCQIQWQIGEPFLLNNLKFAEKIGVSADQAARVREAQKSEYQHLRSATATLPAISAARAPRRERDAHLRYLARCREILYAALTPDQAKRLKAQLGRPFGDLKRITYDTKSFPMD